MYIKCSISKRVLAEGVAMSSKMILFTADTRASGDRIVKVLRGAKRMRYFFVALKTHLHYIIAHHPPPNKMEDDGSAWSSNGGERRIAPSFMKDDAVLSELGSVLLDQRSRSHKKMYTEYLLFLLLFLSCFFL